MKVWIVEFEGAKLANVSEDDALETIRSIITESDDTYHITVINKEMSEKEYNELPEFSGW